MAKKNRGLAPPILLLFQQKKYSKVPVSNSVPIDSVHPHALAMVKNESISCM